ncbi:MAG: hypothetical protein D6759_11195 [Chloroflexi bacterium]|nr:MAG: hypothetical protein D6759_11195 [Chloroflexota bacterium]
MARSSARTDLERRATRAILSYAFFRWESAVTIAMVILLVFFLPQPLPGWRWWFWIVGGVLAEAAIIISSLTDPEVNRQVVAEMLRLQFDVKALHQEEYRAAVERALEYRERIETALRTQRRGVLRDHLQETARQIDDWIANVYRLARRLDRYAQDEVIARDMRSVPQRIKRLRRELERESDPQVRAQLERTLRDKETQWQHLQQLQNAMQRAALQLESTLSAMGTIYSQVLLIGVKDVDSGRAQRLRQEIADEVAGLQDVLSAMDEVYRSEE